MPTRHIVERSLCLASFELPLHGRFGVFASGGTILLAARIASRTIEGILLVIRAFGSLARVYCEPVSACVLRFAHSRGGFEDGACVASSAPRASIRQ
jgi:hypothetical protein